MYAHRPWLVTLALVAAPLPQTTPPKPQSAAEPEEAELRYADGSVIRAAILQERIEVQTRYGKLTVPAKEIRHIEFGVHLAPGVEKRVAAALRDLAGEQYRTRETALNELVSLGAQAYPALHHAARSADPEVAQRIEAALKRIRAKVPARHLRLREDDQIVTPHFTIVGRILTPAIQARAENFGDLNVRVDRLRVLRMMGSGRDVEVAVDAGRHAAGPGQWLDTGFDVLAGARLAIVASGQIDLWPQGPGQYVCGPAGYGVAGPPGRVVNGNRVVLGQGPGGMVGQAGQYPGALLGRIGANGPIFVIGERYQGSPDREGRLYLQIGPNPWNNPSSGTFQVKISPNRELESGGE